MLHLVLTGGKRNPTFFLLSVVLVPDEVDMMPVREIIKQSTIAGAEEYSGRSEDGNASVGERTVQCITRWFFLMQMNISCGSSMDTAQRLVRAKLQNPLY